jgi:hypothetical protein
MFPRALEAVWIIKQQRDAPSREMGTEFRRAGEERNASCLRRLICGMTGGEILTVNSE